MNIRPEDLSAIRCLGYSDTEARFLYLVATHSGYFTQRQYLSFTDQSHGWLVNRLITRILSRRHARATAYANNTHVYNLYSRRIYDIIDKDNLRNRRRQSIEMIHSVPSSWQLAAIMVFAAALILQAVAMIVNPFFSPALRIQAEHGHSVITRGPYRFLRHPGYLAMVMAMPASALTIGSWLALIPALAFSAVIIRRTALEDWFLAAHLPGYNRYIFRVRYRVFFGIW